MLVCKVEYSKCACLSVKKTISVWFFFFNWLRFLIDFRFADFRIIRISALPVFHISTFYVSTGIAVEWQVFRGCSS